MRHPIDRRDLSFINWFTSKISPIYDHYFRVNIHGENNLIKGPVLFVGNHNGILGLEVFMMMVYWQRKMCQTHPQLLGLTHDVVFREKWIKIPLEKLGCIPARPDLACDVIKEGYSLLVYPGGEEDAFKPFYQEAKPQFCGRMGYVKLAIRENIPIIPVVNIGGHEQNFVIFKDRKIAKFLRLKEKYRIGSLPITLPGLPLLPGLFFGPTEKWSLYLYLLMSALPMPAKMDIYFEKPIYVDQKDMKHMATTKLAEKINSLVLESMHSRFETCKKNLRIPMLGEVEFLKHFRRSRLG